jgi:hypothetical protein
MIITGLTVLLNENTIYILLNGLSQITLCNIYSKMELPLISGFILVFPYRLTNSFTNTPFLVCLVILTCRTINSNKRFYTLFITLNHHLVQYLSKMCQRLCTTNDAYLNKIKINCFQFKLYFKYFMCR